MSKVKVFSWNAWHVLALDVSFWGVSFRFI